MENKQTELKYLYDKAIGDLVKCSLRIKELEAENRRLRELVDGAKEIVEIANCTSPAQCKWKVEWMQKASEALKEASHEGR